MIKSLLKTILAAAIAASLALPAQGSMWQWSQTASTNATADPNINWAEGMSPSSVNDSARAMMAQIAKWRDDLSGLQTTTGTATAFALATNQANIASVPQNGQMLAFRLNLTNGVAPTLIVDGGIAYPIQTAPTVAVASGVLIAGTPYIVSFNTSASAWVLHSFYSTTIAAGSIVTSMIGDAQVTLAKLANLSQGTMIGRWSSGAGVPQAVTVSTGLNLSATTGALTASFPPAGSFKNLVVKVASNTTLTVAADSVTTTDGTGFQTTAVSCTVNLGTTGINALDTGTIAAATWYAIWINVKADGTTGCTGSLQFTANATFLTNRPADYTFYARVGAVRTAAGIAQLMGTWQFGNKAQYKVGLAQTTLLPVLASGIHGNTATPTYSTTATGNFVPTTASVIRLSAFTAGAGNAVIVAPNSSYSGKAAATNLPPMIATSVNANATTVMGDLTLESTNIFTAADGGTSGIVCLGWEDNI